MYLHLGQSVLVPHRDILGIFDLDNASWAFKTREFLEQAEAEGRSVWLGDDLPRSFTVCAPKNRRGADTVYVSQIAPATLKKRSRLTDI